MPLLFVVAGLALVAVGDKKRVAPAAGEPGANRLGLTLEIVGGLLMLAGVAFIVYDMAW
ncbi:hypothetical protein [Yinghuangia soli]|uniref:Uncharacterized protein n=1 Tax=Yinghuangia soli TaxID=2908204 RepID=A0AA41Q6X1_9ACTN|nr:hypothetical protein [Yinghuangia soli]MCF2532055.1 hypothetical protein [Yinghuangia soli]